jgi:hypothetical protein
MTYLKTFTDTDTIAIVHNLNSAQLLIRVIVEGEARSDLISSVTSADRDSLTVTLTESTSGSVLVQVPRDWREGS